MMMHKTIRYCSFPRKNCNYNNHYLNDSVKELFGCLLQKGKRRPFSTWEGNNSIESFDRNVKFIQRQRAATREDSREYDYLKTEVAFRLCDRLSDIKGKQFNTVVDWGCHAGFIASHLQNREDVQNIIMCDHSPLMLKRDVELDPQKYPKIMPVRVVCDEEYLPFKDKSVDLVMSSLSMHWINDLPNMMSTVNKVLKPDGLFLGALFGENTLRELRTSFYLAEQERIGGFSPHVSPFTRVSDIGNLLTKANFSLPTVDVEDIVVQYSDMFTLMRDIKGMGENNAITIGNNFTSRDVFASAAAIYKSQFGLPDFSIPATFQIVYFIGWSPHSSQPKPKARGSAKVHLGELDSMISKQITSQGFEDIKHNEKQESIENNENEKSEKSASPKKEEDSETKKPDLMDIFKSPYNEEGVESEEIKTEDFIIHRLDDKGNFHKGERGDKKK